MDRYLTEDEVNERMQPLRGGKALHKSISDQILNRGRLVKCAKFQNEVVAQGFADAVRREGMKASCGRYWNRRYEATGFIVEWAPTWEHFQHDC